MRAYKGVRDPAGRHAPMPESASGRFPLDDLTPDGAAPDDLTHSEPHLIPEEQVALAAEVFRMLANETRIQLLWAIRSHELPVTELAEHVGKPIPAVSQHLAKLRMARLVATRRQGAQIYYRIENEHVARLVTDAVHNAEHAGPSAPRHHLVATPDVRHERGEA